MAGLPPGSSDGSALQPYLTFVLRAECCWTLFKLVAPIYADLDAMFDMMKESTWQMRSQRGYKARCTGINHCG